MNANLSARKYTLACELGFDSAVATWRKSKPDSTCNIFSRFRNFLEVFNKLRLLPYLQHRNVRAFLSIRTIRLDTEMFVPKARIQPTWWLKADANYAGTRLRFLLVLSKRRDKRAQIHRGGKLLAKVSKCFSRLIKIIHLLCTSMCGLYYAPLISSLYTKTRKLSFQ